MDDVPELTEMKRRANTRSLKDMALLLRYAVVTIPIEKIKLFIISFMVLYHFIYGPLWLAILLEL